MRKIIKSGFKIKTLNIVAFIAAVFMLSSCNKDFENVLPKTFRNDTLGLGNGSKKVLYIILDGVRGDVVRTIAPTNLTKITSHSIYSYDGIADYQRNVLTNAAGWTTMLTGVDYTKHQVTDEAFTGLNLETTPTVFNRVKSNLKNARTVSLASSASFNDKLAVDATFKQTFSDDAAVKTATINELTTGDPSLLVAQFHSAETIGAANGYTATTANYTGAINTLDGYIGEILTALTQRKGYAGENWLVIVSSNKGGGVSGTAPGANIFFDNSRNSFVAFYNPKFNTSEFAMPNLNSLPYAGYGPKFITTTSSNALATQANSAIGNFGTTGGYTFMFKIRNDYTQANYYPLFLGKRTPYDLSSKGWSFLLGANGFQLDYPGGGRPGGGDIRDGKWHTIAFTIYNEGAVRKLALFTDGVKKETLTITNANNDNTGFLRIGSDRAGDGNQATNLLIKEVALFNVSMTDAQVISYMRKQLETTDPLFGSLQGYWPGNETSGVLMKDESGKGNHFNLTGPMEFIPFADISPNVSPLISQAAYLAVPNGVDVPSMIYNWMNITVQSQWGLMGKFYNPSVNLPTN